MKWLMISDYIVLLYLMLFIYDKFGMVIVGYWILLIVFDLFYVW